MSIQKKNSHCMIEWFEEGRREETLGLRVVEKAQRKGVKINDLRMYTEIGPVGSCKSSSEFKKLFG